MSEEPTFPSTIVVVGLPDADADKIPKMKDFLLNKMKERGCSDWESCDVITDANGKSKGAAIITFSNEKNARKFYQEINAGFKFGKSPLGVVRIDDVEHTLDKVPEEPSAANSFLVRDNLHYYMSDERCREQLLIRADEDTTVAWLDPTEQAPVVVYDGSREKEQGQIMTDGNAIWSPKGSYLVTLHYRGVNIWGGVETRRMRRFEHNRASGVLFSPNEEFVLTWNGGRHEEEDGSEKNAIRLFEVQTGNLLATLDCPVGPTPHNCAFPPNISWSADSKFIATVTGTMHYVKFDLPPPAANIPTVAGFAPPTPVATGAWEVEKGALSVYAIAADKLSLELVKTIRRPVNNARVCAWSPRSSRLAVWSAESGSQPSVLEVFSLPDGQLVASKNVFKAVQASIHWHPRGDFIGAQMKIASKTGKTFTYTLEIMRGLGGGAGHRSGVPVETFKLPEATIKGFAWEPTGPRFTYMSEVEGMSRVRTLHVCSTRADTTLEVATLELSQPFTDIRWSPLGHHLAVAAFAKTNGLLDGPIWHLQINGGNVLTQQTAAAAGKKGAASAATPAAGAGAAAKALDKNAQTLLSNSKTCGETPSRIEILAINKQFMLNNLEWDSSGRYILSSVQLEKLGNSRYANETGYSIFTFQGRAVLIENKKKLISVSFRPHCDMLLSDDQIESCRKDLKSYTKRFEVADEAKRAEAAKLYAENRAQKQKYFTDILAKHTEYKAAHKKTAEFTKAVETFATKKSYREVEELMEEVIEEVIELIDEPTLADQE